MATYMTQFSYTAEAWAALAQHPQDRSQVLSTLLDHLGGRLINLYYSFGAFDGIALFEVPDDVVAATVLIAAMVPGHIKSTCTTKLLSVGEALQAMQHAGQLSYPGPSGDTRA
jgi:uncharacterized protein with GYD domain